MTEIVWSPQPEVFIRVAAQTAKTTLIRIIAAGGAGVADSTMSIDDPTHWLEVIQGPAAVGPKASIIPDAPFGGAGYSQTSPYIGGLTELVTKTTQALRKAESWGWSHALSNIRKIILGDVYLILNLGEGAAFAPPQHMPQERRERTGKSRVTPRRGGRTPAQAALSPLSAEETELALSVFR